MVKSIGWFSDCHLGLSQYGLQARYEDMFKSVESMFSDMATKRITQAICTGDLLNSTRPSPETVFRLQKMNSQLMAARIQCLTMMGNHDLTPPPNWVDLVGLENGSGWLRSKLRPGVLWSNQVVGFDYCSNEQLRQFPYDTLADKGAQVIGIHAAVQEFVRFKSDSMLSIKDLPLDGRFAAVLLGDIHVCDIRQTAEGVLYGYPGSTELCSESEADTKFWIELILEGNRVVEFKKHVITTRPVLRLQVSSEAELSAVLVTLAAFRPETLAAGRNPLVFLRYDPAVPDVVARVRQAPGSEHTILRLLVMDQKEDINEVDPSLIEDARVDPIALLRQAVPDGPLQVLAERLLNPGLEARPVLREFVEERLQ